MVKMARKKEKGQDEVEEGESLQQEMEWSSSWRTKAHGSFISAMMVHGNLQVHQGMGLPPQGWHRRSFYGSRFQRRTPARARQLLHRAGAGATALPQASTWVRK